MLIPFFSTFPFTYKLLETKFEAGSQVTGIQILKLIKKHENTANLRDVHILVVTGSLNLQGFGSASAATYDGTTWMPFLLTSKATGEVGTIATIFTENVESYDRSKKYLAKGYVILISLAIALALVFLLVVCGVLASYIRRRREGYVPAPTMSGAEKISQMQDRLPPNELLQDMGNRGRGPPTI